MEDILVRFLCQILEIILLVSMETIGNGLLIATVLFEKSHLAEQKRTIVNHLASTLCLTLMAFNITVAPFWVVRLVTDHLSKVKGWDLSADLEFRFIYILPLLVAYFETFRAQWIILPFTTF